MSAESFEKEMNFFIKNQAKLVEEYQGKVMIIVGEEVVGAYNSPMVAYDRAMKKYQPGTFMLQQAVPGPEAYTATLSTSQLISS